MRLRARVIHVCVDTVGLGARTIRTLKAQTCYGDVARSLCYDNGIFLCHHDDAGTVLVALSVIEAWGNRLCSAGTLCYTVNIPLVGKVGSIVTCSCNLKLMCLEAALPPVTVGKGEGDVLGTRLAHSGLDVLLKSRLVIGCHGRSEVLGITVHALRVVHIIPWEHRCVLAVLREHILLALFPVRSCCRSNGCLGVRVAIVTLSPPQHGRAAARCTRETVVTQELVGCDVIHAINGLYVRSLIVDIAFWTIRIRCRIVNIPTFQRRCC